MPLPPLGRRVPMKRVTVRCRSVTSPVRCSTVSPRFRRLAIAALLPGLALTMSGCYSGFAATTNVQATQNTGNGVRAAQGDMLVDNATLVRGPDGSASGTLIMGLSNRAREGSDALVAVEIGGQPALLQPAGPVTVDPQQLVLFGFNSDRWINTYSLEAGPSSYVPVRLTFERAGILEISVLTVEPTGMYDGIAPNPPSPPLQ